MNHTREELTKRFLDAEQDIRINATLLAKQTDMAREAENKAAPLLDACKWLLFHAENGRRKRTVTTLWLDFSEDEFEGRLRAAIKAAERRKP